MNNTFQLRVTTLLLLRFKETCKEKGLSASEVIRRLMADYCDQIRH